MYDKVGMDGTKSRSRAGFGFFHDGSVDSLARFVSAEVFDVESDQQVADLVAFMLAFSGSDFEERGSEPPGSPSLDAHAAVGRQATLSAPGQKRSLVADMVSVAAGGAVDLVVKTVEAGVERGWLYAPASNTFLPDQAGRPALDLDVLRAKAKPGAELVFTVVPLGSGSRIAFTGAVRAEREKRAGQIGRRLNDAGFERPGSGKSDAH